VYKSKILFAVTGLLAGLIIGFFVANALNRGEVDKARSELARLRAAETARNNEKSGEPSKSALTDDEIRNAIAAADARPDDLSLQRKLGLSLYLYSGQTPQPFYLEDVVRLLQRAATGDGKDYEVIIALANVLFDIAQTSDPRRFTEARGYYLKALEIKPDDANARTDLGLTYYLGQPSEPQRAISEYRRSLLIDPRHELTLENLATALMSTGQRDEARRRIEELSALNPAHPSLPGLRAQLARGEVSHQE
jgi:tetratricopeptide (TPR) repeat protein